MIATAHYNTSLTHTGNIVTNKASPFFFFLLRTVFALKRKQLIWSTTTLSALLYLPHLVIKVQSCTTLLSSWTPISGSVVTGWPLWRQCKVVILSTKAAAQWKGSRSPLKTTWRWDGSSDMVCSSRGPSEQHGGKRCRCEGYTSLGTACAALSLPSLSYIFPQKLLWVCRSRADWMQTAAIGKFNPQD